MATTREPSMSDGPTDPAHRAREQAWFDAHAPHALARRDGAFLSARRAMWIEWVATGAIGLAGLVVFGWSAADAAWLLLATFWLTWLVDLAQWGLRRDGLAISTAHATDDLYFWQLVAVRRGRQRRAPTRSGHPSPSLGVIVDAVAGGAASVLLVQGLARSGVELSASLGATALWIGAVIAAVAGFVGSLRARLSRRADGSTPLPVFAVGQRGIGLLVLVFALMAGGGGSLAATALVGCAYGFFVVMGLVELVWGMPALRAEADWVRAGLGNRPGECLSDAAGRHG